MENYLTVDLKSVLKHNMIQVSYHIKKKYTIPQLFLKYLTILKQSKIKL